MKTPPSHHDARKTTVPKARFSRCELTFQTGAALKGYSLIDSKKLSKKKRDLRPLGEGGSSVVYLAKQKLYAAVEVTRAVKFFIYRDDVADLTRHKYSGPVSTEEFLQEVANIAQFNHENLLKVIDAGLHDVLGLKIPFIVTEYIEGPTLAQLLNPKKAARPSVCKALIQRLNAEPETLLRFLHEIGLGLLHLHSRNFSHCDIAPKNIFIQPKAFKPVIGDLGTGKSLDIKTSSVFVCGTERYMPQIVRNHRYKNVNWTTFQKFHPWWDVYAFIKTAQETLNLLSPSVKVSWRTPLQRSLQMAEMKVDFFTLEALVSRIAWLNPVHRVTGQVPELSPSLSSQHYKLMPVQSPMLSFRLRRLAEHPALTRLAKVPQITSARHIFPGALHTRYEHSLGTMETVRRYLQALLDRAPFLEHLSPSAIETALVSGLLFSMTRFPFSNVIHEIKAKHKHLLQDLSRAEVFNESLKLKEPGGPDIREEVAAQFPLANFDLVRRILVGEANTQKPEEAFIHSLLNCSLDARVVDFVRRDSLHLGLSADSFSLDELLPHLTIDNHRLALSISGLSVAEEVICLRYWLFNRIYWNYPNRCFVAMFRHLFMELANKPGWVKRFRHFALNHSGDEILHFCASQARAVHRHDLEDLGALLTRDFQSLYKIGFEFNKRENHDLSTTLEAALKKDHEDSTTLQKHIAEHIAPHLRSPINLKARVPVLIDLPREPGGHSKLGEDMYVIKHDGNPSHLSAASSIIAGVQNSFDNVLLRMRVLIHPALFPAEDSKRSDLRKAIHEFLKENVV